jgi:hypothetical protein
MAIAGPVRGVRLHAHASSTAELVGMIGIEAESPQQGVIDEIVTSGRTRS